MQRGEGWDNYKSDFGYIGHATAPFKKRSDPVQYHYEYTVVLYSGGRYFLLRYRQCRTRENAFMSLFLVNYTHKPKIDVYACPNGPVDGWITVCLGLPTL